MINRELGRTWIPLFAGIFVVLLIIGIYVYLQGRSGVETVPSEKINPPFTDIEDALKEVFIAHDVLWELRGRDYTGKSVWYVRVPGDLPIPSIHLAIQEGISRTGAYVLSGESEPISGLVSLLIGWQDSCLFRVNLHSIKEYKRETGRIALLIDDFGDRWDDFIKSFFDFSNHITISILPGLKLSSKVAIEAGDRGCEVILHLPMEPVKSSFNNNGFFILTEMTQTQINKIILKSLDNIPNVVGVNNHMGSRVTAERRTMTFVLDVIRSKGLFFLDSKTTASSVAYRIARELGIPCGKRDVFLDIVTDQEAIRQCFDELARKAQENGFAIGIGHCHRNMLVVLREKVPELQARGFKLVRLSEVIR
jgi:polysaccharide deacetylase 2 family uncharacterized protein YibQ